MGSERTKDSNGVFRVKMLLKGLKSRKGFYVFMGRKDCRGLHGKRGLKGKKYLKGS